MEKMTKSENRDWLIPRIILGIVMAAFLLTGFVFKPASGGFLWDALHPMNVLNIIGVTGFVFVWACLSGYPQRILNWGAKGSAGPNYVLFGVGIVSIILLFV